MRNKNMMKVIIVIAIAAAIGAYLWKAKQKNPSGEIVKEITPTIGPIRTTISSTGTILPKNRLEVKPPVNGRIETLLVKEGDHVKVGDVLAWMSSTERAALLDSARGKGEGALAYWQETYKPIPLPASIEGEVIVAKTQPGQTVTTADAIVVLSDRLIVRAQVDETDIGSISPDMQAVITLDAYPDTKIHASVDHIYYESQTVNNVTIYQIDLIPEEVPPFFRSGMNATVDFIIQDKKGALLVPVDAVNKGKEGDYVLVKKPGNGEPVAVAVQLGISDDKNIEILSGVGVDDTLVIRNKKYAIPQSSTGTNPFMPSRRR